MDKESIGEIRGIAEGQNIESNMENVLSEKLKEFPDGQSYQKKVHDMKLLTQIYDNYKKRDLTRDELTFLYEIDDNISGFGYKDDPRIAEIKNERDKRKDLSFVFDCLPSQIGFTKEELYNNQLVYYEGSIFLYDYNELIEHNIQLPKYISGSLCLDFLTSAEGLVLPKSIGGFLYLQNLKL